MAGKAKQPLSTEKESKGRFFRLLGLASTVGINFIISILIGFLIGHFLDRSFDTSPWLTIIFLILGIAAGFKYLFKIALKTSGDKDKNEGFKGPRGQGFK